jgi:hypothetical protein
MIDKKSERGTSSELQIYKSNVIERTRKTGKEETRWFNKQ